MTKTVTIAPGVDVRQVKRRNTVVLLVPEIHRDRCFGCEFKGFSAEYGYCPVRFKAAPGHANRNNFVDCSRTDNEQEKGFIYVRPENVEAYLVAFAAERLKA